MLAGFSSPAFLATGIVTLLCHQPTGLSIRVRGVRCVCSMERSTKGISMRRTVLVVVLAALVGALVATPVAVYASHQFTDVPNSNIFHSDIDWLADAGVTKGCNPPANDEFCPKDVVTRETMAAFLHRLAENQVVDAGSLEGMSLSEVLAAGIQGYEIATNTVEVSSTTTFFFGGRSVSCPDGTKVIGGGASAMQPNGAFTGGYEVLQEFPGKDGASWVAIFDVSKSSGVTVELTVYAICAVA